MRYTKTEPCPDCPFLVGTEHAYSGKRLRQFANGEFPCHKTAKLENDEFIATGDSVHCAGALIYCEKRNRPHQMMRISERLGMYDYTKLSKGDNIR